jgi:hypothetical protein
LTFFQRGKFQANMVNLVQMNTPRVVMTETKKAFRNIFKRGNLESAAQALCNLKGVGPTMASGTEGLRRMLAAKRRKTRCSAARAAENFFRDTFLFYFYEEQSLKKFLADYAK